MAKQGMKKIERNQGKQQEKPVIDGTCSPTQKIYYNTHILKEKKISSAYPVIDNDLARDNVENDLSDIDLLD